MKPEQILIEAAAAWWTIEAVWRTWIAYRYLPEKVPIHFGPDLRAGRWGPRWLIWLVPCISLVVWGGMSATFALPGTQSMLLFAALIKALTCGMMASIVRGQLKVALGHTDRLSWGVFGWVGGVMALSMLAPFWLVRH